MIIKENVTLYTCEHCKKKLFRRHAMENHEKRCINNPENARPCLNGCKHLENVNIEYDSGCGDYIDGSTIWRESKSFYCELHKKLMMHPKADRESGLIDEVYFHEELTEQTKMPKECVDFTNDLPW